jgi:hypothetical protein
MFVMRVKGTEEENTRVAHFQAHRKPLEVSIKFAQSICIYAQVNFATAEQILINFDTFPGINLSHLALGAISPPPCPA